MPILLPFASLPLALSRGRSSLVPKKSRPKNNLPASSDSQEAQPPHAAASIAGKNQVVEDGEVDRFACTRQPAGGAAIGLAGPWIAARMIVRQDDAGTAKPYCVDNDVAHRHFDRFRLAVVTFDVEAASCGIDMSHPEPLPGIHVWVEAGREEAVCGFVAIEEGGVLRALVPHALNLWRDHIFP